MAVKLARTTRKSTRTTARTKTKASRAPSKRTRSTRAKRSTRKATRTAKSTTKRSTSAVARKAPRRTQTRKRRALKPVTNPTLWPQDQTGIKSFSERVVINVETASFVVTWVLLSAIVTAMGIVLLMRAPLII